MPSAGRALAGGGGAAPSAGALAFALLLTLAKVAGFASVMLVVGRRVIPWVLHHAAHTGSRELFRLSVYAVALGVAYAASALFGVSFALGAFFAGTVAASILSILLNPLLFAVAERWQPGGGKRPRPRRRRWRPP